MHNVICGIAFKAYAAFLEQRILVGPEESPIWVIPTNLVFVIVIMQHNRMLI